MKDEEIVLAGFNHGYLLASKAPQLYNEYIPISRSLSPYALAYRKGAMHAIQQMKEMERGPTQKKPGKQNRGNDMGR